MNNLPTELYKNIFASLKVFELSILSKTDVFYRKLITEEIESRFIQCNRLKNFFNNTKEFHGLLNENCLLSGSMMIQFLLNETYSSCDVDIYITGETSDLPIIKFLEKEKYKYCPNDPLNAEYRHCSGILNIKTFYKKCKGWKQDFSLLKKVQLIISNNSTDIINNFDFNIAKNYYDGTTVFITESLATKTEIIFCDDIRKISKERLEKYLTRGFKFEISMDNQYSRDINHILIVDIFDQSPFNIDNSGSDIEHLESDGDDFY